MIDINQIPQSFTVEHKYKEFCIHTDFVFINGTKNPEWTGYYGEHRICIRAMEQEWVCEVLKHGIGQAILRWPKSNASLDDLKTLVSCACYYIDSLTK